MHRFFFITLFAFFVTACSGHAQDKPYGLLYALSGYDYNDFKSNYAADILIVDKDDSQLTREQIKDLQADGTKIYSYISIGEAESYRDYWQNWQVGSPDFILAENENWAENYLVKFWQEPWQSVMEQRILSLVALGYDGAYLDIVDGYTHPQVIAAWQGSGTELRQAMENFVIRLSQAAKSVNPTFAIIPQNAPALLAVSEDAIHPNIRYLSAIDGLGVESLWYDDNELSEWTKWDLPLVRIAKQQGKFILATSYPQDIDKQKDYFRRARKEGFHAFVGDRSLSKQRGVATINRKIPEPN